MPGRSWVALTMMNSASLGFRGTVDRAKHRRRAAYARGALRAQPSALLYRPATRGVNAHGWTLGRWSEDIKEINEREENPDPAGGPGPAQPLGRSRWDEA